MSALRLQSVTAEAAPSQIEPPSIPSTSIEFRQMSTQDVLKMVSGMLNEIVTANDSIPFNENKLTRFHSRAAAGISIKDYLLRIVRFTTLDPAILIVLVYYIDLLSQSYPNFVVNSLTVHRFIITSVTVASKGLCDSFCVNSHYAKVGGLQQMELNLLEVEFLTRVGYRIAPSRDIFEQYFTSMLGRHGPRPGESSSEVTPAPTAPSPSARPSPGAEANTSADDSQDKNKFSRAMKSLFHPAKKRGSETQFGDTKRPKQ